jgi:hypothetical protein
MAFLSVVFSWRLQDAFRRAVWLRAQGYRVRAGGPAVVLNPGYMAEVAEVGGELDALSRHNPDATFTTRGCVRRCGFCAVPRIEGELRELRDWEARPVVCDNNLLAASRAHFDRVIDRLKPVPKVDFNQGLDGRLLTSYHAERLAELDLKAVRLAWDDVRQESQFMQAFERLRGAKIAKKKIRVYVLIGYCDTPEDAYYRLEEVRRLGVLPNPMRYQPLDSVRRNEYIASGWCASELVRFMRYWSNFRMWAIPFGEFR